MPWKCSVCGAENPDDADRCLVCGTPRDIEPRATEAETTAGMPGRTMAEAQAPEAAEAVEAETETPGEAESMEAATAEHGVPETPSPEAGEAEQTAGTEAPPNPRTHRYYLVVINSPVTELMGMKIPLQFEVYGRISLGRSLENVIVVPDPSVSRRHALVYIEDDKVVLEDLGSTNGTYIYDPGEAVFRRVDRAVLKPGMLVRLGEATVLRVEAEPLV
ncbi:FHA domain-containing protein [Pyrodictium delaneyi]|uniref:FHA domain-containing protein n=1 Tax=Pyrodictium delaneyi TaxID=1273541 RepID=A0A211YN38_9CREN|nr:FHA domain-containing protein [Pyrodictium delaneyi]OWJ54435.1 hypothetical protein Pdsh_08200 [Pyrodictium delaneyi]